MILGFNQQGEILFEFFALGRVDSNAAIKASSALRYGVNLNCDFHFAKPILTSFLYSAQASLKVAMASSQACKERK